MTDDSDAAPEGDLENGETDENDEPIDLEAVETRLKAADRQLQALLEATEGLEAPDPLRRRIAETRTELLTIRHEFKRRCPDSSRDRESHHVPPSVARGTVHTILGP